MRTKKGIVTGNKMDKTIVVTVHSYKIHPKYKKRYRVSKKFYAHAPEGKFEIGDKVEIYETTPMSKLKKWTTRAPEGTVHEKSRTSPSKEESPS